MNRERLDEILFRYPSLRIAVVGDYFLDRYWDIDEQLDEPSIETGLTAYQTVRCRCAPGAAGTVVNNLVALGVGTVYAIGFTGRDGEGYELRKELQKIGVELQYLFECPSRSTPCYTKPLRNGKELNRFDTKNRAATPPDVEDVLIAAVRELAERVDAVMIMDQVSEENCGAVTEKVRKELIRLAEKPKSPVMYADSRERIGLYQKMFVKCNEKELLQVFGLPLTEGLSFDELGNYAQKLSERTEKTVFVTMGEAGQLVVNPHFNVPSVCRVPAMEVSGEIDTCGAGDAASSGIVASLCAGADTVEASFIGNLVSSITIQQLGQTGTASREQIRSSLPFLNGTSD